MNTRASGIRAFGLRCVVSANKRPRLSCSLWWTFSIFVFCSVEVFGHKKNGGSMAAVHVHILFVLLEERFA